MWRYGVVCIYVVCLFMAFVIGKIYHYRNDNSSKLWNLDCRESLVGAFSNTPSRMRDKRINFHAQEIIKISKDKYPQWPRPPFSKYLTDCRSENLPERQDRSNVYSKGVLSNCPPYQLQYDLAKKDLTDTKNNAEILLYMVRKMYIPLPKKNGHLAALMPRLGNFFSKIHPTQSCFLIFYYYEFCIPPINSEFWLCTFCLGIS